ncbi:hypothetical protein B0A55_05324 [Friedmanniomyces simplex]|uniref:Uncharacterized protein n=1 Tax=Friedmanniomyces simplex TaxID=329884 RepID=A0A4U0XFX0_9PEZI|nr:hypothetical protein B0A55_05324 [Friedmanniomyces simplex]
MPYFVAPRANMISSLSGAAQHRQSTDPLIERSPGDGVISSAEKDSAALRADDGLPTVESAIGSEGAGVVISEETLELSAMPHLMQHPESASPDTTTIPLTSRLARNNTADSSMGVEPDVEDALPATDPPHAAPVTRKCIGVCRAIEPIAEFAGSRSRDPVLRCLDCRGLVLDTASGRARKRTSADKAVMMPPGLTQDSADEVGLTEGLNVAYLPPANDVRRRTRGQLRAERRASQRTLDASSSPKVGPPANSPLVDMPPLLAVPNKESRRSRTSKEAGPSGAQSSVPAAPNGFPLTTTSPPTINEMSASVPVPMDDAGPDFSETFQVDNGLGDDSVARLSTAPDMVSKTDIIPPSSTDSLQVNSPAEFKPLLTSLVDCKPILSSDILRDPESSPVKLHADSLVAEEKHTLDETKVVGAKEETPLVKPEHPTFVSRSSSPVFSCIKEQSPRAVYSRAVSAAYPGSLADRSKQSDLTGRRCASTPASSGGRARASTVGRAIGNVRKSMQMRAKVEDSSEDELAL